jgi:ABC-2 type transport system permease protein
MSSTVADAADERAPSAAPPAAKALSSTLLALVRREFWEHRSLWVAPSVVAALMVLGAFFASVKYRAPNADLSGDQGPWNGMTMFAVMQGFVSSPLSLVTTIVLLFYLLDCLYAERRDRSFLFWKSLPVSDGLTVLSKFLVAVIIVPLGVYALGLVVSLLLTGMWQVNAALGRLPPIPGWDMGGWLQAELALLACLFVAALWYAPWAAYLLVVSAWARRNPLLWFFLPPVAAQALERIAFGTHYIASFIAYRLFGIWPRLFSHMHFGRGRAFAIGSALPQLDIKAVLADVDLWLGLAAAAGLVYAAIRLRRYRDDT